MASSYSAGAELDRAQFLCTEADFGISLKSTLKTDSAVRSRTEGGLVPVASAGRGKNGKDTTIANRQQIA